MKKIKKSVLFICADQWRFDCFSFLNHEYALTPNLDKLAKKSVIFKSHFAGIVPCGPSRTTMLTGLYPFIHRSVYNGAPLDKRFTNIAKEVRKLNYNPRLYGYTDTSWDPRYLDPKDKKNFTYESPMEGFDDGCVLPGGKPEPWANHLNQNGFEINKAEDLYKGRKPKDDQAYIYEPYYIPTEFSDTAFLADKVVNDLKKVKDPFFMHVSFLKPHPPFHVADPWFSKFNPDNIKLPQNDISLKELSKKHPLLEELCKKFLLKENFSEINYDLLKDQDIKNIMSVYFAMCAEVDFNIGKILNALKESGQEENTMIIFTSDHGEMLNENNLWGKLGWWDSSYRIPLFIYVPQNNPKEINHLTESVDVAPTILEWLGGEIPIDWNGQSLMHNINHKYEKSPNKEYVVFDYDFRESTSFVKDKKLAPEQCNLSVIRNNKWKYVHFPSLPCLLFDLEKDPEEINDLSDLREFQDIKHELVSKLLSHRMIHQERQLSNTKLSSSGVNINSGPFSRKME